MARATLSYSASYVRCVYGVAVVKRGVRMLVFVCVWDGRYTMIEATTGVLYPLGEAPYLGVEQCWNHTNHYVNMQDTGELALVWWWWCVPWWWWWWWSFLLVLHPLLLFPCRRPQHTFKVLICFCATFL